MRVLIVGGSALVQDLVSSVLADDEVVVEGSCGDASRPDVVVRVVDAADAVEVRGATVPEARPTVVLAAPGEVAAGRVLGIDQGWSLIAMDAAPEELRAAVHLTARGAMVISAWARPHVGMGRHSKDVELTRRELEVLEALAEGLATKNIGRRLNLASKTVEVHKANLFKKLGVRTQAEAVSVALTTGLLPERAPGSSEET